MRHGDPTQQAQVREAIMLAYYEGLSRDELAVRLAMPVGSVKTWLRRGSLALRDCLDGKS